MANVISNCCEAKVTPKCGTRPVHASQQVHKIRCVPQDVCLKNAQGMRTIIPLKQQSLNTLSLHRCRIVHVRIVMHLIIETFPHLY